jgi:hypothetical protein
MFCRWSKLHPIRDPAPYGRTETRRFETTIIRSDAPDLCARHFRSSREAQLLDEAQFQRRIHTPSIGPIFDLHETTSRSSRHIGQYSITVIRAGLFSALLSPAEICSVA